MNGILTALCRENVLISNGALAGGGGGAGVGAGGFESDGELGRADDEMGVATLVGGGGGGGDVGDGVLEAVVVIFALELDATAITCVTLGAVEDVIELEGGLLMELLAVDIPGAEGGLVEDIIVCMVDIGRIIVVLGAAGIYKIENEAIGHWHMQGPSPATDPATRGIAVCVLLSGLGRRTIEGSAAWGGRGPGGRGCSRLAVNRLCLGIGLLTIA